MKIKKIYILQENIFLYFSNKIYLKNNKKISKFNQIKMPRLKKILKDHLKIV